MQYKLSPIQNDEQAEKDYELAEQGVSKLKTYLFAFPRAILNLPGHYRKLKQTVKDLEERYDSLVSDYDAQSRELQRLEDERRQLNEQVDRLQDEIKERDRKIQTQNQTITQKDLQIQTLKGPSYTIVGGDSKTTYAQWIDKYRDLYRDYRSGVLEVVDPARFDEVYQEIATILEKGLKDKLSEDDLTAAQTQFADYLIDDADLPDDARANLQRFVEKLFEAANSAEASYKESFILCNLSGTQFDFNYARIPERPMADSKGDKGKKIVRCHLPAVFFYFKNEQASVCAPALVELEENNNDDGLGSR